MIKTKAPEVDKLGNVLVNSFHKLGLFVIGAVTVWAAGYAFYEMLQKSHADIPDLLLLFIYLEIGAMVGIYFKTNHMPVRFLIYIGITALTRHLVDLVAIGSDNILEILTLGGTILILSISVLIIRFTSHNYPSNVGDDVS